MAAYIIVNVDVTDAERYATYTTLVGASIAQYGGRFIVRAGRAEKLEGAIAPKRVVVLEFPSLERAKTWWGSEEYREAKAIRQRASTTDMIVAEGVGQDPTRELLRHALATVAYRGAKVVSGAPDNFAAFRCAESSRTAGQILAHVGDLFDWALSLARGAQEWHDSAPLPWADEVARFFDGLARFDACLDSGQPLAAPAERLLQGPIADALTHVGQIAMLRRMASSPIRGENYYKADIAIGRVRLGQVSKT